MAWTLKDRNGECCGCHERIDPCLCNRCDGDPVTQFEIPNASGYETKAADLRQALDNAIVVGMNLEFRGRGGTAQMNISTVQSITGFTRWDLSATWRAIVTASGDFYELYGQARVQLDLDQNVNNDPTAAVGFRVRYRTAHNPVFTPFVIRTIQFNVTTGFTEAAWDVTEIQIRPAWDGDSSRYGDLDILGTPDTEDAAIGRLLGGVKGAWGAWTSVSVSASWQDRAGGRTFVYRPAQWRVAATGNTCAAGCYYMRVTYYRRAYGTTGEWVAAAEEEFFVQIDNAGNATMYLP